MDWAKMMGRTPDMFTFMGRVRGLAAVHLAAHLTLGVLHGDAALGVVDEDDQHDQQQDAHDDQQSHPPLQGAGPEAVDHAGDTMVGTRDMMPANRIMEMPLPIPNSVICSPIHITKEEPAMKETVMTRAAHTDVLLRMP